MTHRFACRAEGWQHFRSAGWGPCRRSIEVGDDQLATRQIDLYDCGEVRTYDRTRARDEDGMLIGLRFSLKPKWRAHFTDVEELTEAEFEREWRRAVQVPGDSRRS